MYHDKICLREEEINDTQLYREFCGNIATPLENPEFEGWQGSFAFTSQRCYNYDEKKQKDHDVSGNINSYRCFVLYTVIAGKSEFIL